MYLIQDDLKNIKLIPKTDFSSIGVKERQDIEEWVEKNPAILDEELLIIQKEFDGFGDTKERLDLLAIDVYGNLVIIELKRDDSGTEVNWQAIKYAAYCSTLSNEDIFDIYSQHIAKTNGEIESPITDAIKKISEFLDVNVEDLNLNNKQRIILVSKEYRKEVLATVMWLLENDIDVKCVKIQPYKEEDTNTLYLVPTVILPPPDTEEYRIKKNTVRKEQERKIHSRGNHYPFFDKLKNRFNEVMGTSIPFSRRGSEIFKVRTAYPLDTAHFEFYYKDDSSVLSVELHFESTKDENLTLLDAIKNKVTDWESIPEIELNLNWRYGVKFSIVHNCLHENEDDTLEWGVTNMKILYDKFNPALDEIFNEGS